MYSIINETEVGIMTSEKKEYKFKSSSGLCDISAWGYFPENISDAKGIIQIAHGMAEHHERYEDFITFLNDNGYIVFINDHLGHGKSVKNDDELGYFGDKAGYIYLVEDMKKLSDTAKSECPGLPFILFGHSMGSMLARLYTERYASELNAAVYCGTSGPNPAAKPGVAVTKMIASSKGSHHRSKFIDNLAFGSYNKKFKPQRTSFDWLTKDNTIVDKYIADPYCGFLFTAYGYRDLLTLVAAINRPDWYTAIPSELPVYLISGEDDPVGNYGKGVRVVYDTLVNTKHTNTQMKLFANDRHEILNELDKDDVYKSILDWLETVK